MSKVFGPTGMALIDYQKELAMFLCGFLQRTRSATTTYKSLIEGAKEAQKMALTFKTAVGAAVQTDDGEIWRGANVENMSRSLDDHAENRAVLAALERGYKKSQLLSLALVYGS